MPICSVEKCSKEGIWRPVLLLKKTKSGNVSRCAFLQIAICDSHKKTLNISSFLSDEGFAKISRFMAERGKVNPSQQYSSLDWEIIDKECISNFITNAIHNDSEELAF